MEIVHTESLDLDPSREAALLAYIMARGIYANNAALEEGRQPTDNEGNVLGVQYRESVPEYVRGAYGHSSEVDNAIIAAYEETHPKE